MRAAGRGARKATPARSHPTRSKIRPRLLVMDEPAAGLVPLIVKHILELLHGLKGRGVGILVVEPNVRLIAEVADPGGG